VTAYEKLFWLRVQRQAAALQPEFAQALLRAFALLRSGIMPSEVARLLTEASVERMLATAFADPVLYQAFLPVRDILRQSVAQTARDYGRNLPIRTVTVAFDSLNPKVITAIRSLETRVIDRLQSDVRDTVRAYVENGLRDGAHPREVARDLRAVIGLAPNQEQWVRNYRKELQSGDLAALDRRLHDRRFSAALRNGTLTPEKIDRMVDIYRKRMLAFNAETNARTAALDSHKLGQRLTWDAAVARGDVDGNRLMKRWVGVKDDRERPEHLAMEGERVPYDEPFSNGEQQPGDSTFNCRCVALYFQAPVTFDRLAGLRRPFVGAGSASATME
jgi:hypothetical protein